MLSKNDLEISMIALDLLWGELYDTPADEVEASFPEPVTKQEALDAVQQVFERVRANAGALEGESIIVHYETNKEVKDLFSMYE